VADRAWRRLQARLRGDPIGLLLLGLGLLLAGLVLAAPLVTAENPVETDFGRVLLPPSAAHWLGTDDFGRDVLARLLHGGRASLSIAGVAVLIAMGVGVTIGLLAGYLGGAIDLAATKLIDVLLAFPRLVLAIAVAALMGGGILPLIIAISIVAWPAHARIIRGFTLQLRGAGHVLAARCLGTPTWKILLNHVALALLGPILVLGLLDLGSLILAVSALSFLGLGIAPPAPEWGAMLNEGRASMAEAPWLVLAPGCAILIIVLALNHLGDALRDGAEGRPAHGPGDWLRWPAGRRERRAREARLRRIGAAGQPARGRAAGRDAPLLELDAVSVRVADPRSPYHGRVILDRVGLAVRAGECVGLVGESGSGKSTIAMLALGLMRPPLTLSDGGIRLFGEDVAGWRWDDWQPLRGRFIALVNQDPLAALNPVLRIGVQLREAMQVHGAVPPDQQAARLRDILADVDLPARVLDQYPHELSGGMCQRVVIAMAVVNRPALLIADEPTTALDVTTQARVLDLLRRLQRRHGLGLLFISHDLRVVARVADRVVVLRDGQVVEAGETRATFATPAAAYTRALMAALPGGGLAARAEGPPPC
jgi:peptide/nickel transport system permease protein